MSGRSLIAATFILLATIANGQTESGAEQAMRPVGELARAGHRIDAFLGSLVPYGFSGAAVVALGDEVLLKRGYGLADRDGGVAMTPDTVSTMGSITKQFTAAGILKLADQGRLRVEDPITRYFDAVPEDKRGITLHHLLTHTSGLGEVQGLGDADRVDADQFVKLAMQLPLNAPPGEAYDYTNTGYSLLGIIIEKLTGESYEQWLRDAVLIPAGLTHTGYQLADWDGLPRAEGYRDGEHWGQILDRGWLEDGPGWILRANGGLHTVLDDMLAWRDVLRGASDVLSDASRRAWITPHRDEGGGDSFYGYGWEVHPDTPGGPMVAHNGGNSVFSADFIWLAGLDLFIYIQGNQSVIPAANLRPLLLDAAFDPDAYVAPAVTRWTGATPEQAADLAGSYAEGRLDLRADHLNLLATIKGQDVIDLLMGHDQGVAERFASLTNRARTAIPLLLEKDNTAFDHFFDDPEEAARRADSLLNWVRGFEDMAGPMQGLELLGTVRPVPGLAVDGAVAVTYMSARFDGGIMVLGMNWDSGDAYLGTTIGPPSDRPSVILVPTARDQWRGWVRGATEQGGKVTVDRTEGTTCLGSGELRLCRDD